jgi:hypothetical protein
MQTITVFVDGKSYSGRFAVNGDQVTLECAHGRCVAQTIDASAVMIAAQSLRDLIARQIEAAPSGHLFAPEAIPA